MLAFPDLRLYDGVLETRLLVCVLGCIWRWLEAGGVFDDGLKTWTPFELSIATLSDITTAPFIGPVAE